MLNEINFDYFGTRKPPFGGFKPVLRISHSPSVHGRDCDSLMHVPSYLSIVSKVSELLLNVAD